MSAEHHNKDLQKAVEQLEAELRIARQQLAEQQQQLAIQQQRLEARRQEFSQEYGPELLALLEGDPRARIFITPVVEKLVFQDNQGNVISKTDGIVVGKIIEVKFVDPSEQGDRC